MKRIHLKTLAILLSAVMLLSILPASARAAESISYLDENGVKQEVSATRLTNNTRKLQNGWYYVRDSVKIRDTLVVSGDVKLILTDGCSLDVESQDFRAALQVEGKYARPADGLPYEMQDDSDSLTIYAQSSGNQAGKLFAKAKGNGNVSGDGAGIGGRGSAIIDGTSYFGGHGGNITICGGVIEASSVQGAGIGGGGGGLEVVTNGQYAANLTAGGFAGNITITGGIVKATSTHGAGIGSGVSPLVDDTTKETGSVTITGGTVTATSENGAGIGGGAGRTGFFTENKTIVTPGESEYYFFVGHGGHGGVVNISGGTIKASAIGGGNGGAGAGDSAESFVALASIGNNGGNGGEGGSVAITGGLVDANRIGGGNGGRGQHSYVTAANILQGTVLLGSGGSGGNGGNLRISDGAITAKHIGGGNAGAAGTIIIHVFGELDAPHIRVSGSSGGIGANIDISGGSLSTDYIGGGNGADGSDSANSFYSATGIGGEGGEGGNGGTINVTGGSLNAVKLGMGGNAGDGGDSVRDARGGDGGAGGIGASITVTGGVLEAGSLSCGGNGGDGGRDGGEGKGGNGAVGGSGGRVAISGGAVKADAVSCGGAGGSAPGSIGRKGSDGGGGSGGELIITGGKLSAVSVACGSEDETGSAGGSVLVTGGNLSAALIANGVLAPYNFNSGPGSVVITGGSVTNGKGEFPVMASQPTDGEENVYPETRTVELDGLPVKNGLVKIANMDVTPSNIFISETDEDGMLYLYTRDPGNYVVQRISQNHDRAIAVVNQLKLMTGDENGDFRPMSFLTRAELATVVTRALTGKSEAPDMSDFTTELSDIKGKWYENYVKYLEEQGLVGGYHDDEGSLVYGGEEYATVGQAMKLILGTAGYEAEKYGLTGDGWEKAVRRTALANRADFLISSETGSGENIYRSEMAQLLFNSLGLPMANGATYTKSAAGESYTVSETPAHLRFIGRWQGGGEGSPVDVLPGLSRYGHTRGENIGSLNIDISFMAVKSNQTLKAKLAGLHGSLDTKPVNVSFEQYKAGSATAVIPGESLKDLLPGDYQLVIELYEGEKLLSVFEGSSMNGQLYIVTKEPPQTTPGPAPGISGADQISLPYMYTADAAKEPYSLTGAGPFTVKIVNDSGTGATIGADGILAIPAGLDPGTYSVIFSVSNGNGTRTKTVTVIVEELSGYFALNRIDASSNGSALNLTNDEPKQLGDLAEETYLIPPAVLTELMTAKTTAGANADKIRVRMENGVVTLFEISGSVELTGEFPAATVAVPTDRLSTDAAVLLSGEVRLVQVYNSNPSNPTDRSVTLTLSGTVNNSGQSGVYMDSDGCTGELALVVAPSAVIENEVRISGEATIDVTQLTSAGNGFNVRWVSYCALNIKGLEAHFGNSNLGAYEGYELLAPGNGAGAVGITRASNRQTATNFAGGICTISTGDYNYQITIVPPSA